MFQKKKDKIEHNIDFKENNNLPRFKLRIKQQGGNRFIQRISLFWFLIRRQVISITVLVCTIGVTMLILNSSLFSIKDIAISPIIYLSKDVIDQKTEGVIGENIFRVDLFELKNTIKTSSGFIKDIQVQKILPNKLYILIEEREPFAIVETDKCLLINEKGVIIQSEEKDSDLQCSKFIIKYKLFILKFDKPILENTESQQISVYTIDRLKTIADVVKFSGYTVNRISILNDKIIVSIQDNKELVFGENVDLDIQLKKYLLIISEVQQSNQQFVSIDFRFERPVLKVQ